MENDCEISFPDSTVANFGFPAKSRLLINPEDDDVKLNGFRILRRKVENDDFFFIMGYGGDNAVKHAKCYLCLARVFKGGGVYLPKISQSLSFNLPKTAVASDMGDLPENVNTNFSRVVITTGTEKTFNVNVDFEAVSFSVESVDRQESRVDSLIRRAGSFEFHKIGAPALVHLEGLDTPFVMEDGTTVKTDKGDIRLFENAVARHLTPNCGTLRVVSKEEGSDYKVAVVSSKSNEDLGYAATQISVSLGDRKVTSVGGGEGLYGYTLLGMEDGRVVLLYLVNGLALKKEFEPDLNDGPILQIEILPNNRKMVALTTSGIWVLDMEEEAADMKEYLKTWLPHLIYIAVVILAHYLKG